MSTEPPIAPRPIQAAIGSRHVGDMVLPPATADAIREAPCSVERALNSVRLCMAHRSWSIADLARRARLGEAETLALIAREVEPSLAQIKSLATACGVGIDALLAGLESITEGRRVPMCYVAGTLRCTLPMNEAFPRFSYSVDLADGTVLRLHMSEQDMRSLIGAVKDLAPHWLDGLPTCQEPISSSKPSVAVSTPQDSDHVLPTQRSSTAC